MTTQLHTVTAWNSFSTEVACSRQDIVVDYASIIKFTLTGVLCHKLRSSSDLFCISLSDAVSRITYLDASENGSHLWTYERAAGIGGIDMKPHGLTITHHSDLFQVVE